MQRLLEFIGNHYILATLFALVLGLFIRNEIKRGGATVTPQELVNLVNQEGALVLDVREQNEYNAGHIVGSVNIPYGALNNRLSELERHREKAIVIACKMGQHAGLAGNILKKAGFERVARLKSGMTGWTNENMPVVRG